MRRLTLLGLIALLAVLLHRRRLAAGTAPLAPSAPAGALSPAEAPAGPLFLSVPWSLVDAPEDRGELTLRYACDARAALDRVDVQETDTQVFVTVLVRSETPARSGAWSDEAEATAALERPLGARALVHAPVDDPAARPLYP